jgi:uncharacterized membrane protein
MMMMMMMVMVVMVVVVMHRGAGRDRGGGNAEGDNGRREELLDHVRHFRFRFGPHDEASAAPCARIGMNRT